MALIAISSFPLTMETAPLQEDAESNDDKENGRRFGHGGEGDFAGGVEV